ncbi:transposase [uncultured Desulfobacter sp.]|uniref:IS66 family transposase n=1 Tax=uncultured Desulfobacter sp. TaxID=240139 RepID=UPI002AAAB4B8|nr:transposase [uncultured Desulfobacter sp.]
MSRNFSDEFKRILCNCLTHARRNFVDVEDHFPDECEHVINVLADVYHNDDQTKKQAMTPEQRLTYHQEHSGPLMADLLSWLNKQLNGHLVEPNSGLGTDQPFAQRTVSPFQRNYAYKTIRTAIG